MSPSVTKLCTFDSYPSIVDGKLWFPVLVHSIVIDNLQIQNLLFGSQTKICRITSIVIILIFHIDSIIQIVFVATLVPVTTKIDTKINHLQLQ